MTFLWAKQFLFIAIWKWEHHSCSTSAVRPHLCCVAAACGASRSSGTGRCICFLDENKLCQYEPIWGRGWPPLQELLIAAFSYLWTCLQGECCSKAKQKCKESMHASTGTEPLLCKCCVIVAVAAPPLRTHLSCNFGWMTLKSVRRSHTSRDR